MVERRPKDWIVPVSSNMMFKKVDIDLPRTTKLQAKEGEKVEKKNLRSGDLIFLIRMEQASLLPVFIWEMDYSPTLPQVREFNSANYLMRSKEK